MWPDELYEEMTPEERAIQQLLRDAHLCADHELPGLFEQHATALGVRDPIAYVADLQQRVLIPFLPAGPRHDANVETLTIDATLPGRAFQHVEVLTQPVELPDSEVRVWLPLLDGTERLGVLGVVAPSQQVLDASEGVLLGRLVRFATLAAELIMTKSMYGDSLIRLRRTSQMGLAAEMQWSLLPPMTFASRTLTIAGGLEPAYEVAGDTLDYAVDGDIARLALLDGMGHGLQSAQLAALTVAAYRNARRSGQNLTATVQTMDDAVATAFNGDAFITGQIAELDVESGSLEWVNAGHPDPLLIRGGRLVKTLSADPILPLGLGGLIGSDRQITAGTETLEPGDLVVLYSDGVVEARSPEGEFFGVERMVDMLIRNLAAGLPAPETLRRVIRALLDHQMEQLSDDASLLMVQHRPDNQLNLLP